MKKTFWTGFGFGVIYFLLTYLFIVFSLSCSWNLQANLCPSSLFLFNMPSAFFLLQVLPQIPQFFIYILIAVLDGLILGVVFIFIDKIIQKIKKREDNNNLNFPKIGKTFWTGFIFGVVYFFIFYFIEVGGGCPWGLGKDMCGYITFHASLPSTMIIGFINSLNSTLPIPLINPNNNIYELFLLFSMPVLNGLLLGSVFVIVKKTMGGVKR
jgi:hypothetical protein